MATITPARLTLQELANRTDPKSDMAQIAEVLAEDNPILDDATWVMANDTFAHVHTRRISLPQGSWRKINDGVASEFSRTKKVTEIMGMLETYSKVDQALVEAAANPKEFRNSEALAFVEGMSQTLAETMIYGSNDEDPEKFTGFSSRLNSLSQANVLGAGGSGEDLTSIYVVQWGERRTHLIYPKNSPNMGIRHNDIGLQTVEGVTPGTFFQAYVDHFQVVCGLCVRDDRTIARLANIETSGTEHLFDEDLLIELLNRMPKDGEGAVIYCNSTIKTQMEIKLKDKTNVNFSAGGGEGLSGVPILRFRGIPVRKVEAITDEEAEVS